MTTPTQDQTAQTPQMAQDLKQDAARLKDTVGARARQEAESRKGQAAHLAGSASSALETAAQDLRDNPEAPDWMASALQQAARKIQEFASHVDGRSVEDLGSDVADFARRSPGTFLIASAAAGFAAARVLRAGADKKRHAGANAQGMQGARGNRATQGLYAGDEAWAADENVKPTGTGSFESAYLIQDSGSGTGGTGR